ncbi:MAG: extracellular solute-binding protein [Treponema sp.]|nr:extracellular solute-binding protein [Treponema sp.]
MKKNVLLVMAFFLIGSLAFAGGGQSGKSSSPQTRIVMASWYGGGSGRTLNGTLVEEFEKSHPNVKIVEDYTTYNEYHSKINSMIAAGNAPDIMYLEEFRVNEWGERGVVADLNPYYKDAGIDPKTFYVDGALFTTGGKLWGVSNQFGTVILYYNKKLFKEAGITPPPESAANPWTWEQFVTAAKKLTKDSRGRTPNDSDFNYNNVVQYGTTNAGAYGGSWVYILPFIYTAGSSVANADGTEIEITKPAGVRALQNIANLALVDRVAPTVALSTTAVFSSLSSMLMNDQVAMYIANNGEYVNFANENYDVGIAQIPSMSGRGNNMFWGNGITLKPGASKEAFEFMTDLLDFNKRVNAAKTYGLNLADIPQTRSVFDDPARNRAWLEVFSPVMARVTADILQNGSRLGEQHTLKNFAEIMDRTLVPSWDKIWLGTESAQQVLGSLRQSLQGMLQGVWR